MPTHSEPYAFSKEVLSGYKNKFGKFFGTDHLLLEGWRSYEASYEAHLKTKPSDDGVYLCFYIGAMAMFKTMLEMFSVTEQVLKRIEESSGPSELWEEYRTCLASDIPSEVLDQHKKAYYGGCWFINATFMVMTNEEEEQYLRGMEALRDEINEFRTNLKQSALEFVLKLSEELAQQISTQPTPENILESTASTFAISTFMISLEHEKIKSISCPKCSGRSLQEISRGSLNPRKDLDWPYHSPGGDEYHYRCSNCGHSFPVTFWFTK